MTLNVVLESGEDGWVVAHVPALRGCVSQGKTREEALLNIREAIAGWLEVADEEGTSGMEDGIEIVPVAVHSEAIDPRCGAHRRRVSGTAPMSPTGPTRILVVDDERHIVRLIQVNLERQGLTIDAAFDGVEALAKMRAKKPDLVVLDTDMPRMNGWQVLEEMANDPELCDIRVVLLTPEPLDDDDPRWPPSGRPPRGQLHLTKPFNPMSLLEALG